MKNYTVFNITSKEIVRNGSCPDDVFALQAVDTEHGVLEGQYSNLNFYVTNNIVIPYTEEQVALKANKPNMLYYWSNETFNWIDTRTETQKYNDAKYGIKFQRNKLLVDSDWTDTLSAKSRLGDELYQQWQTYRQALRDITNQTDPFNITWPTPPQ